MPTHEKVIHTSLRQRYPFRTLSILAIFCPIYMISLLSYKHEFLNYRKQAYPYGKHYESLSFRVQKKNQ